MRRLHILLAVLAVTVTVTMPGPATAHLTTPLTIEFDSVATGRSGPVGDPTGTVCDPKHWGVPGADTCRLWFRGTFRGTVRDPDGTGKPVHGRYWAWTDVGDFPHAPGCLESGDGRITYSILNRYGRTIGTVTAILDSGDSEVCQSLTSTDRRYGLRADPVSGTGVFAGLESGNTLLTGEGTKCWRSQVYRDTLDLHGEVR